MDAFGRIDLLVNNAGGSPGTSAATASPNFTSKIVTLNLTSPMVLSQKVNAIMQEQDSGGIIVNIASVAGLMPSPMLAAYGAAKAGLINMTRSLAVEYAPKVRVNCIAPGFILTEGADYLLPTAEAKQAAAEQSPLRYLAGPDVIADACVFLASPASRYVNGETIVIDGGGRIRPAT
jgi:NAD(P)-dependent dehydrogenase (short-subunit alcohol dehydrogenase family)